MIERQPDLVADQDLHAFIDGALDRRRYRKVVAHLAANPAAAEQVNDLLRQQGEMAMLRENLADLELPPNPQLAALAHELAGQLRHRRRVHLGVVGSGLGAAILAGLWSLWGPNPRAVAEHLAWPPSLMSGGPQVLFGRDPFSNAPLVIGEGDDGPILLLDRQLASYSLQRPDLAAFGLRFLGGNALQGGAAPAIRLVYEDPDGRQVFLFVGSVGSGADVALTLVPEGHVSLHWRRGPLVFALIGPKDSDRLVDVMRAVGELLRPAEAIAQDTPAATDPAAGDGPAAAPLPMAPAPVIENRPKLL
jgi:anti-sigma factor RsiW